MSNIDNELYEKARYIRMGLESALAAILLKEVNVDPYLALDEIAIMLRNYTASMKEAIFE